MLLATDPEVRRQAIAALVAIGVDPTLLQDYRPHRDERSASAPRAAHTPLLDARQVAAILSVPVKAVYTLPIPRVMVSTRRCRWRLSDVEAYIQKRRNA
jgi:predicted DNA-binding transcriptional regulator AlpA